MDHKYDWADDDFDIDSFKANNTTTEYYSKPTPEFYSKPTRSFNWADDDEVNDTDFETFKNDSPITYYPKVEETALPTSDEHHLPPHPSTPEPTEHNSSPDGFAPQYSGNYLFPGDHSVYLQPDESYYPFPAFNFWLRWQGTGWVEMWDKAPKPAYPELSYDKNERKRYTAHWRTRVKEGQTTPYQSSSLRNEVELDNHEEEPELVDGISEPEMDMEPTPTNVSPVLSEAAICDTSNIAFDNNIEELFQASLQEQRKVFPSTEVPADMFSDEQCKLAKELPDIEDFSLPTAPVSVAKIDDTEEEPEGSLSITPCYIPVAIDEEFAESSVSGSETELNFCTPPNTQRRCDSALSCFEELVAGLCEDASQGDSRSRSTSPDMDVAPTGSSIDVHGANEELCRRLKTQYLLHVSRKGTSGSSIMEARLSPHPQAGILGMCIPAAKQTASTSSLGITRTRFMQSGSVFRFNCLF